MELEVWQLFRRKGAIRVQALHSTAALPRFTRSRMLMSFGFIVAYTVVISVAPCTGELILTTLGSAQRANQSSPASRSASRLADEPLDAEICASVSFPGKDS